MIRQYLDLSTMHITKQDNRLLLGKPEWPHAADDYSWWIWVPSDPEDSGNVERFKETGLSPAVWGLILYARKHGCDYICLDCDADVIEDLPTFEW